MASSKFLTIVCDGMADEPIKELGDKTPLEYLKPQYMNSLVKDSVIGLVRNVPEGMNPGSDTANLSVFGYNPVEYYTGRSPLEAVSMGIELGKNDAAFRCNIVNITDDLMSDFTANHIETEYASELIRLINDEIDNPDLELHAGVSYRHALIWRNYPYDNITSTVPPHDIQDLNVSQYIPSKDGAEVINYVMELSRKVLNSPEAQRLKEKYNGNPTSAWIWGGGTKPALDSYVDKYGLTGYTISAVDLIHGIGRCAGLDPIFVEGATGYIDTNYEGKAEAAIKGLQERDYVFLHFESPDESGHEGNLDHKLKSIRDIDERVIKYIIEEMQKFDDYTILILPDHPTPINVKTHTSNPVPFLVYSNNNEIKLPDGYNRVLEYSEKSATESGFLISDGYTLMSKALKKDFS